MERICNWLLVKFVADFRRYVGFHKEIIYTYVQNVSALSSVNFAETQGYCHKGSLVQIPTSVILLIFTHISPRSVDLWTKCRK